LVLDEPTSALEVSVQVVILQLLKNLKRQLDLSYLFVSHNLNVVRLLCDRILVMYLGHIVESGPADRVFAAPAHLCTKALLSAVPKPCAAGGRAARIGLRASLAARSTQLPTSARFTADAGRQPKNARRSCRGCARLAPASSQPVITRSLIRWGSHSLAAIAADRPDLADRQRITVGLRIGSRLSWLTA
jgi:ABC-type antimicrobial peptide transport system ATPase subunit